MMRRIVPLVVAVILVLAIVYLPGWDQGAERVDPDTSPRVRAPELPPGHPPIGGTPTPARATEALLRRFVSTQWLQRHGWWGR